MSGDTKSGRTNYAGTSPLEPVIGYSRVVRVGNIVHVAGTTATNPDGSGQIVGVGDMYAQARQTLENIAAALAKAGVPLSSVVRTRMFVTDISRQDEAGRAHGEFFREILPVASMIGVSALVNPEMLIEIEVEAILEG
jgi:enamine deaminase RidA (YjgF/YER057c/UK114 family)